MGLNPPGYRGDTRWLMSLVPSFTARLYLCPDRRDELPVGFVEILGRLTRLEERYPLLLDPSASNSDFLPLYFSIFLSLEASSLPSSPSKEMVKSTIVAVFNSFSVVCGVRTRPRSVRTGVSLPVHWLEGTTYCWMAWVLALWAVGETVCWEEWTGG